MNKTDLRRQIRTRRRDFVAGLTDFEREELQSALLSHVESLLPPFGVLGGYVPVGSEIGPDAIVETWPGPLALPWFAGADAPMTFRAAGLTLQDGPFGIPQPAATAPELEPDALLVPLVAATENGARLGQGKGHYDRYVAARRDSGSRPLLVGLAWDCQVVDSLPVDPWDEMLDFVATPSALYGAA